MFLISNGDLNCSTPAIIVERADELDYHVAEFIRTTGTPHDEVVVNRVGDRIDPVSRTSSWLIAAGLA